MIFDSVLEIRYGPSRWTIWEITTLVEFSTRVVDNVLLVQCTGVLPGSTRLYAAVVQIQL
jgi:hypothetical protein